LKSFGSNKVIIEVVQKSWLWQLIGVVQSLVAKQNTKTKRVVALEIWTSKIVNFNHHGKK
jgi:hypothetical protein